MKITNTKKFWQVFDNISIANGKNEKLDLPQEMKKSDGSLTSSIVETLHVSNHDSERFLNSLTQTTSITKSTSL